MKKRIRTILQYIFFMGLGIFLVWWSVKDLTLEDRHQIKESLRTARYWLILPVLGILFLSHYIRAVRWRLLIEPLGYKPSTANAVFAVFIGYLVNQALPRLGEVIKCTILSRYEKIPADKLVGTIILERLIDAISLMIVFAITLVLQPGIYSDLVDAIFSNKNGSSSHGISLSWILAILGVIILIVIAVWMIKRKKNFRDLGLAFKKILNSVWQGIGTFRHLEKKWFLVFLSASMWTLYLLGGFIGFLALKETQQYGIPEAFTVLSAGSVGMVMTPGGIGAYAYLLQKTMQVYGLQEAIALAFGWILWVVQTSVIVLGGLISFVLMPHYNKKRKIE